MKQFIKNNLFGFILGAILFSGIGTVLATTILSSTVSYTNNSQTTVEGALNDLYYKSYLLDNGIDPRGLNTDGTGGRFTFVYWNDNFSNSTYAKTAVPTGSGLNGTYSTRELLATAYTDWEDTPVYIKTTKVNGTVTGHVTCLWYNNREFCIAPNYWTGTIGVNNATEGANTKAKLKADMENALGITIADSSCYSSPSDAYCDAGDFYCYAASRGYVSCNSSVTDGRCFVDGSGDAGCY